MQTLSVDYDCGWSLAAPVLIGSQSLMLHAAESVDEMLAKIEARHDATCTVCV